MSILRNHNAEFAHWKAWEVKIIDDRAVRFSDVCVHDFTLSDVDDPVVYASEPIWQWQQSDAGKWVMENAVETPYWMQSMDYNTWGHRFKIMARLSEQNETYFRLKFK